MCAKFGNRPNMLKHRRESRDPLYIGYVCVIIGPTLGLTGGYNIIMLHEF